VGAFSTPVLASSVRSPVLVNLSSFLSGELSVARGRIGCLYLFCCSSTFSSFELRWPPLGRLIPFPSRGFLPFAPVFHVLPPPPPRPCDPVFPIERVNQFCCSALFRESLFVDQDEMNPGIPFGFLASSSRLFLLLLKIPRISGSPPPFFPMGFGTRSLIPRSRRLIPLKLQKIFPFFWASCSRIPFFCFFRPKP